MRGYYQKKVYEGHQKRGVVLVMEGDEKRDEGSITPPAPKEVEGVVAQRVAATQGWREGGKERGARGEIRA